MTDVLELVRFLSARVAEDEAVVYGRKVWPVGSYMEGWSPARVQAECRWKRQAISYLSVVATGAGGVGWRAEDAVVMLRFMAQPYAGHEGFRAEWRVQ